MVSDMFMGDTQVRAPRFAADWPTEPQLMRPALRKRPSRRFTRAIAFGIGVAVTVAWQCYGDAARGFLAERYLALAWLAPRVAPSVPAETMPPIASLNPQDLKTISLGLAAVRQSIDQLAAGQDQINREMVAQVQAAKQDILDKISWPSPQPSAPAPRKAGPQVAPPSSLR
jgi:hypothetical protein